MEIFKKNIVSFEQEKILKSNFIDKLSLSTKGIYFTQLKDRSSDIFRTIDYKKQPK